MRHSPRKIHPFPLHSHRNNGLVSSHGTPSFRSSVPSPSLHLTTGLSSLKNNFLWHGVAPAGRISPRITGRDYYGLNLPCFTIARYRITLLYGADCWRVTGVMKRTSTRTTSRSGTGSGPSNTTPASGFTVPASTSSAMRTGAGSTSCPN